MMTKIQPVQVIKPINIATLLLRHGMIRWIIIEYLINILKGSLYSINGTVRVKN